MSPEKLARMANQIAAAFGHRPDDEAAAAVAAHVNDFWDPRMRAELLELIAGGASGLHPAVRDAAAAIRPAAAD
ncbi:formate dehydrogenase subunit delta [Rhodovulum iodosum]|uniref:Formate dehydrogenase subunit delta n=1 Tax=Rhodovulum iodosum TaxID=68291 RepID=A0ABV3XSY2_9RHOB|nr:formate dehydrogenase subunit delta [Rhodovulum robiginosum]RSK41032.1 formate dehydrogenase [Rhodovulum robiginosum]